MDAKEANKIIAEYMGSEEKFQVGYYMEDKYISLDRLVPVLEKLDIMWDKDLHLRFINNEWQCDFCFFYTASDNPAIAVAIATAKAIESHTK